MDGSNLLVEIPETTVEISTERLKYLEYIESNMKSILDLVRYNQEKILPLIHNARLVKRDLE